MTSSLARFQDAFVAALDGGAPLDARVAALAAQPGFAVYRNTVFKGCVDALAANFPAVARLVGKAWFDAAAMEYARHTPPEDARLLMYGATFPAFLADCESARELTWLGGVARLDRLWCEAHTAADDVSLDASAFVSLTPEAFERLRVRTHASARWAWFDAQPVRTIWSANRAGDTLPDPLEWRGEGVLILRRFGGVTWASLGPGACAMLDACAAGATLGEALERALSAEPGADLGAWFADLVSHGALAAATPGEANRSQSQ
ncbi:putative DNA-binding protein [Paraburkholderia unamae]|uniref:HvfC/BufC N-terminal domain-containing protein n=1 Tax=Paraburkholderia unamae TaxID=219649 RepID=UPI000DC23E27|nr:DNA-binding domain-containing protein [Paraburkholderia unamae]RAR68079.1 putative DNA-binding protein [Paraburkholderia unamae]